MAANYQYTGASPVWTGPPSYDRIRLIHLLTAQDRTGRLYYRLTPNHSWQRLKSYIDHELLNRALGNDHWDMPARLAKHRNLP